jgi:microcystin-dependent protein
MSPRCGCASDSCSCKIVAGVGIAVEGTGSQSNPVVVSALAGAGGGGGGGVARITGEIISYGGALAPEGWLVCDGSQVSRTVYADLFTVLGVSYGAGNGTNTFNLPNLQGRVPIGVDGTFTRGSSGGAAAHTLTAAELPSHTHGINHDHPSMTTAAGGAHDHSTGRNDADGASPTTIREGTGTGKTTDRSMVLSDGTHTHAVDIPNFTGTSGATGGGSAVPTISPYTAVVMLIKT